MTQEEKIIATAFTGKMFIDGSKMGSLYEYMEKKVGHGVIDLMLASKEFWEELHKACEQDFIDMVSKEQPSLPSNLDEAAEAHRRKVYCGDAEMCQFVREVFKSGAEWMATQWETIDGEITTTSDTGKSYESQRSCIHWGRKSQSKSERNSNHRARKDKTCQ